MKRSISEWLTSGSLLTLLCLVGLNSVSAEESDAEPRRDRRDLLDRQLDVSHEARDVERVLTKIKLASELAKQRITEAAATAEGVGRAIERGDSPTAKADAEKAEVMFKEIIKQLNALLADETPERLRAAQKLAEQISEMERKLMEAFPGSNSPTSTKGSGKVDPESLPKQPPQEPAKNQSEGAGQKGTPSSSQTSNGQSGSQDPASESQGGKDAKNEQQDGEGKESAGEPSEDEKREALAKQAEQIADTARTLEDVLKSILESTDPSDQDAVRKVDAILKESEFTRTLESVKGLGGRIRAGELEDSRLAGQDIADRMEILSQRLDAAYRLIVAPRAEELRKLEEALSLLRERLETLETESQVTGWHREARQLLNQMEKAGVSQEPRDQLQELIDKAGLGTGPVGGLRNWANVDGRYVPPGEYHAALEDLQEDVQRRIQTLLLGDREYSSDEASPPKYKELVDRYYEVLSREGERPSAPSAR